MGKILIIDDDVDMCLLLKMFLTRKGYEVIEKYTGKDALEFLTHSEPDLIISDLRLGDMSGLDILKKVKTKNPRLPFIMITAYDDIETSLAAIQQGALNYAIKPIFPEEIYMHVQHAFDMNKKESGLEFDNTFSTQAVFISGNTEADKKNIRQVDMLAPTNNNIIIYGEPGVGKKMLGRRIHEKSHRKNKPLIFLHYSALAKNAEGINEYIKASKGGTLFLENITSIPFGFQTDLLKALNNDWRNTDFAPRIIASSKEPLWNSVLSGELDEQLFYHINNFDMEVLPLRKRKEDIMLFADLFLKSATKKFEKYVVGFTKDSSEILENYLWPGNLYELNSIITKAVLLSTDNMIQIKPAFFPEADNISLWQ